MTEYQAMGSQLDALLSDVTDLHILACENSGRNPFKFPCAPIVNSLSDLYLPLAQAPAEFWTRVRSDGGDIRVYKQDGTQVARQLVSFDSVAKTGSLFIKANSGISFWIEYGNANLTEPAAGSTYGSASTWETALPFVLHGDGLVDSTSAARTATATAGISVVTGKLSKALASAAETELVTIAHDAGLVVTNLTAMGWFYFDRLNTATATLARKGGSSAPYGMAWAVHHDFWATPNDVVNSINANGYITTPAHAVITGAWYHLAYTQDSASPGNGIIYVNGVSAATGTTEALSNVPAQPLQLFNRFWDKAQALLGKLCEFRWYNRLMGPTEIAEVYANQNAPESFWTVGAQRLTR